MPKELITLSVGQCGNQLGLRFWEAAVAESTMHSSDGSSDDSMSVLFQQAPPTAGSGGGAGLRARAVLVDMVSWGRRRELMKATAGRGRATSNEPLHCFTCFSASLAPCLHRSPAS